MISALVNEASQGLSSGLVMRPMQTSDLDAVLSIEYRIYPYPWARGHFADSLNSGYACWVGRSVAAPKAQDRVYYASFTATPPPAVAAPSHPRGSPHD